MAVFTDVALYCWSDSMVVLNWIRGHPSKWQTFVANRVSTIQTVLTNAVCYHVAGRDNPADCASRDILPGELPVHDLWWHGPSWLSLPREQWPTSAFMPLNDLPEGRAASKLVLAAAADESCILNRFSSLRRLLRVTAWCLKRRTIPKRRAELSAGGFGMLSLTEIEKVRRLWIRLVQKFAYEEELTTLA